MHEICGKMVWVFPDMYMPSHSDGQRYKSHEAICVINLGTEEAVLDLTLIFEDREPVTLPALSCGAMRTNHIRLDRLSFSNGEPVPRDVPYAAVLHASAPVVAQYTRVDTTQPELALMTTLGFGY